MMWLTRSWNDPCLQTAHPSLRFSRLWLWLSPLFSWCAGDHWQVDHWTQTLVSGKDVEKALQAAPAHASSSSRGLPSTPEEQSRATAESDRLKQKLAEAMAEMDIQCDELNELRQSTAQLAEKTLLLDTVGRALEEREAELAESQARLAESRDASQRAEVRAAEAEGQLREVTAEAEATQAKLAELQGRAEAEMAEVRRELGGALTRQRERGAALQAELDHLAAVHAELRQHAQVRRPIHPNCTHVHRVGVGSISKTPFNCKFHHGSLTNLVRHAQAHAERNAALQAEVQCGRDPLYHQTNPALSRLISKEKNEQDT
jgi:DNA repair exonuclease SbcCD ATPase subunit